MRGELGGVRLSGGRAGYRSLDRRSPVPLYYQLQEILKEEIENGRWSPGETIPSEVELADIFGISRTVIRNALDILEGDGQVFRVKGKGTVVAQPKVWYEAVTAAAEFTRGSTQQRAALSKVVESRPVVVGGQVGHVLSLPPEAAAFLLTCVHSVDGVPASLSQVFLRPDASPALEQLLREGGVPALQIGGEEVTSQLAGRYGVSIATSEVIVEATRANDYESGLLDIGVNTPVFLVSTVDRRENGVPVAFTRMIARGDTFRFAVRIRERAPRVDGSQSEVTGANHREIRWSA